ncbi:hypothetical protein FRB99_000539 [Tulasnella sp. 403]|nr:hypothetical protein FRB99_000539 [Tulasnella sp. 403]
MIGPNVPSHLLKGKGKERTEDTEESSDDEYGPSLPPDLAPRAPGRVVGPSFPTRPPEGDDSDEDYGPTPMQGGQAPEEDAVKEFIEREERRRAAIEVDHALHHKALPPLTPLSKEGKKPKELKREEWMLAPPEASDLLGSLDPSKIRARQFSKNTEEKVTDRTLWTETPAEKQKRLADEVSGKRKRAEVSAGMVASREESEEDRKRRKRDDEIRQKIDEHNKQKRGESLLDIHSKSDTSSKEEKDKTPAAIWDHSRDMGLGGRLMDERSRQKIIGDAKGLGSRFGHIPDSHETFELLLVFLLHDATITSHKGVIMHLSRTIKFASIPSATSSALTARAGSRLAATSRHLSNPAPDSGRENQMLEVKNMCVFGAGLMGEHSAPIALTVWIVPLPDVFQRAGIVQVAASKGFKVTMCDVTQEAIDNGWKIMTSSIKRLNKSDPSKEQALHTLVSNNVVTTTDPVEAVTSADLVVEAIVENLKVKQDLFALLDRHAREECLFATNTSSLSVKEIASSCQANRRANPQMKLVEVVKAPETSDETIHALLQVCARMEKAAVQCNDTPGFIVNRLLVPYMFEAIKMVERGDASAEDVDTAMKLGAGHPMGPLQLADFVGLDTCHHIMSGWREKVESGEETGLSPDLVSGSKMLSELVKNGKLGRKTGEGFFKYEKK